MRDFITELIAEADFGNGEYYEQGPFTLHLDESGFVQVYEWRDNVPVLIRDQKWIPAEVPTP